MRILAVSSLLNIVNSAAESTSSSSSADKPPRNGASDLFDGMESNSKDLKRQKKKNEMLAKELRNVLDADALDLLTRGLALYTTSPSESESIEKQEDAVQNVQIALEVLGQFCSSLDGLSVPDEDDWQADGEEWKGILDVEEDSFVSDMAPMNGKALSSKTNGAEAMDEDDGPAEGDGEDETKPSLASSMKSVIVDSDLVQVLLRIASSHQAAFTNAHSSNGTNGDMVTTATNAASSSTPSELSRLRVLVQLRAIQALNNLLLTLSRSSQSISGVLSTEGLQALWSSLFDLFHSTQQSAHSPSHMEYSSAILGCILAMAQMGLDQLTVGSGETPVLVAALSQPTEAFTSWEEVKIRILAILSLLGTRADVSIQENDVRHDHSLSFVDMSSDRCRTDYWQGAALATAQLRRIGNTERSRATCLCAASRHRDRLIL